MLNISLLYIALHKVITLPTIAVERAREKSSHKSMYITNSNNEAKSIRATTLDRAKLEKQ